MSSFDGFMIGVALWKDREIAALEEKVRAQSAELASLRAEVDRCHARLEIDHLFTCGGKPEDGGFLRVEVPMDERRDVPDGITCRDATIDGQNEVIASLRARLSSLDRLKDACDFAIADMVDGEIRRAGQVGIRNALRHVEEMTAERAKEGEAR